MNACIADNKVVHALPRADSVYSGSAGFSSFRVANFPRSTATRHPETFETPENSAKLSAMTRILNFRHVLTPDGILPDQQLHVDGEGRISAIQPIPDTAEKPEFDGFLALPGMPNAHSHCFQRALAGFGEQSRGEDSFWSWREAMYKAALVMTPDQLHVVARQAFADMLAGGFTSVAEFHYLHHLPDGSRTRAMADAVVAAAEETGIRMRLLPVAYFTAGFGPDAQGPGGGKPPVDGQRRFVHRDVEEYLQLLESLLSGSAVEPGIAPHSLRAVPPRLLNELLEGAEQLLGDAFPIHIHISEQQKEIDDCIVAFDHRPIELLAETVSLGPRWNLVHATHADSAEVRAMAAAGANVVLCPLTEAYLGDGLFDATAFVKQGGRIAIGSDSNARIDVFEELRLLEYGQRLREQARARLADENGLATLYASTAATGASALGLPTGQLAVGCYADIIGIDASSPALHGHDVATAIDALVINGCRHDISSTWVGGNPVNRNTTSEDFSRVVRDLMR